MSGRYSEAPRVLKRWIMLNEIYKDKN
jgi:hypothetical protein